MHINMRYEQRPRLATRIYFEFFCHSVFMPNFISFVGCSKGIFLQTRQDCEDSFTKISSNFWVLPELLPWCPLPAVAAAEDYDTCKLC